MFTEEEKNLKAEPLSKFIQDKIKAYIRDNALRPGDKLPTEAELAAELGASRTAVREACGAWKPWASLTCKRAAAATCAKWPSVR